MTNIVKPNPKPWFSLAALYNRYLRRCFAAAKLTQRKIIIDGGETAVQFWGPTSSSSSSSSKPAVVFVHGFGPEATWQWRRQAVFFSGKFDVYIPNLVFFGESTTTVAERSEVFQAGVVAKLMEKLGVERYSVVGTSYGGFVAYRMANMWPERVEKVIIASSAINMREKDNNELLKRAKLDDIEELMLPNTAKQLRTLLGLAMFRGPTNYMPDFFLNDVIAKLYSGKRKEKLELLKGLSFGQDDNVCLSPLQQDVLILWGEHDQIFRLEKAIELKDRDVVHEWLQQIIPPHPVLNKWLLGQNTRLEVIKNTSHVPQIEDAVQFNNIVEKFLYGTS